MIQLLALFPLILMIGHYFAARGNPAQAGQQAPLYLPRGFIRLVVIGALAAAIIYRVYDDYAGLQQQLASSLDELKKNPMLPLYILVGFLVGNLLRAIVGRDNPTRWLQDFEAWISLIGLVGLVVSAVIHLVVNPSMAPESRIEMPRWDDVMATLVAFYFGARS